MCSLAITGHMKTPKQGCQWEKYCLLFHPFKCVTSKQYNLGRTSSLKCQKTKSQPLAKCWGVPKPLLTYYNKDFYWVFGSFFADILLRQTKNFWNSLGILLQMYLPPEFWRLLKSRTWLVFQVHLYDNERTC